MVSAFVARLADPEIHLAAYGSVVFPLAILIEAPIIMLLAASTALSRDWDSYCRLRRFMMVSAGILTGIHLLVAATPLFDLIVGGLFNAPEAIREPARRGLLIMTPWTASIAYRRFNQGLLIRNDRSKQVGVGTAIRMGTTLLLLTLGFSRGWPGIVTGTLGVVCGVIAEASFVGWSVRPILVRLRERALTGPALTLRRLLDFYIPLALTPLLTLLTLPTLSAGLGRMPLTLESMATWPVVNGLVFIFRSTGHSYNEVVVALMERPGAPRVLRRFTTILAATVFLVLLTLNVTPLGRWWFSGLSGLDPALADMATRGLWLAVVLPPLGVFQNWIQGTLVHHRRTRPISEAVALALAGMAAVMAVGAWRDSMAGLYVGILAMVAANVIQLSWLGFRSRALRAADRRGD